MPAALLAADPKPMPTLVVRLQSIDGLIADARYFAEIAGKAEEAKQAEGMIKALAGPKGVEGLDTKKPIGLYGKLGPNGIDSEVVVMVPIADEETAVDFLKRFAEPEKGKDGVYSVMIERSPFPLYFRFANGYAYVTIKDKEVIDADRLLKPADVLAPAKVGVVSVTVNLDQIPRELKKLFIGQMELQLLNAKDEKDENATEAQHQLKIAMIDEFALLAKQVVNEGGAVDVRIDLDKKAGDLSISASLAGSPETNLANAIEDLGKARSTIVGLVGRDSAINMLGHLRLPERLRKAMLPVMEEGAKEAIERESDAAKKKLGESAWKAILPTLKAAEFDGGLSIRGPNKDGHYALVMGLKVEDGAAIEKVILDAVADLPKNERAKFKANAAKVGAVNIHEIQSGDLDANTREMLGDGPIYLAIRPNAIFLGAGSGGLDAIKESITARPGSGPIGQFEMSVGRSARILAKEQKGAVEAAKKVFAKDKAADTMRFRLEGGESLKLSFSMKTQLIQFFTLVEQAKPAADDDN
jgi:hypothetical protein